MQDQALRYDSEVERTEKLAEGVPAVIGRPETIDALRHERMLRWAQPLIAANPDARWLTIGDGGGDGWMLTRMGARSVIASNISDARLQTLASQGYLPGIEIKALNAEATGLPDGSVDFILCKEAFHHFPRAPIAFYEFMRVARLGVLLLEPVELPGPRPLNLLRSLAKLVLRGRSPVYELFEPVGNYIYRVSLRETFRAMAAMQKPWYAVRLFNDFSTRSLVNKSRHDKLARALFRLGLLAQDLPSACGMMSFGMGAVFIPTGADERTRQSLRRAGYRLVDTPRNPYTKDDVTRNFLSGS